MNARYFYLVLVVVCSLFAVPSLAADLKIGFVNAIKVMDSAPQVEEANKRLEREFEPRQRKLVALQQEIRGVEERLNKDGATMSENENRNINRDLVAKKRELKRQQDEFRDDYNIRRNEELDKLQKLISEVIQTLAREEAYDFVLSDGVVWASDRVDMTDKVLKRLNQEGKRR